MIEIVTNKISVLGQYVRIKCANCGEMNGTWAQGIVCAADCDCTLWEGKGRFRTQATLPANLKGI